MEPLPSGWEMRLDESTGRYYFLDHNNKTTQWKHPVTDKLYLPNRSDNHSSSQQQKSASDVQHSRDIQLVSDVVRKARLMQPEIDKFEGTSKNKEYVRLMETLERHILELDAVDVQGHSELRSMRRAAVVEIQQLMQMLEFRASLSAPSPTAEVDGEANESPQS